MRYLLTLMVMTLAACASKYNHDANGSYKQASPLTAENRVPAGGGLAGETMPSDCSGIILKTTIKHSDFMDLLDEEFKKDSSKQSRLQFIEESGRNVELSLARSCRGKWGPSIEIQPQQIVLDTIKEISVLEEGRVVHFSSDITFNRLDVRVTLPKILAQDLLVASHSKKYYKVEVINRKNGKVVSSVHEVVPGALNNFYSFYNWNMEVDNVNIK